jgi:hypothetical protein
LPTKVVPSNLHQKTFSSIDKYAKQEITGSSTSDARMFHIKDFGKVENGKGQKDFLSKLRLEALQSRTSKPTEDIHLPAESVKVEAKEPEDHKKKSGKPESSKLVIDYLEKAQKEDNLEQKPGDLAEEFQKEVKKINRKIDKIFTYLDLTIPEASHTKLVSSQIIEDSSRDVRIPTQKKKIDGRRKSNSILAVAVADRSQKKEKISIRANRQLTNGSLSRRTNSISDTTSYLRVDLNKSGKRISSNGKSAGRSVEDKLSTPDFVLEASRQLRKTSPWGDKGYTELHGRKQNLVKKDGKTKTSKELRLGRREYTMLI